MALYYRKPINKTVDDVKLKIQMGALTLKLSENINKINGLWEPSVDSVTSRKLTVWPFCSMAILSSYRISGMYILLHI